MSDAADKEGLGGLDSAIANLTRYEQRVSKCVLIDECGHVTKVKTILPRVIFKDQTSALNLGARTLNSMPISLFPSLSPEWKTLFKILAKFPHQTAD